MTKQEAIENDLPYACLDCYLVYDEVPCDENNLVCVGEIIPRCDCGSERIVDLREVEEDDYPLDSVEFH